ncbi:adenylate kinase [Malassezia sp. CBS 17886]|nr:adenylate kinase [Malassezia sp. CBS 17886]
MVRSYPNVVVTGTPGTGKSTLAAQLCDSYSGPSGKRVLRHIDVGPLVKEQGLHKSYDADWDSYEVNEDRLLDYLEPWSGGSAPDPQDTDPAACAEAHRLADDDETRGGLVLDWHTCDAWPERWADLVIVLRNYPEKKIAENNEAEIMGVIADDALDGYAPEAVVMLTSESADEMESNIERVVDWVRTWRMQRGFAA